MTMPSVIVVFGASGSGKSTLMEQLAAAGTQYSIHIKHTSRPRRQYDGIEIRSTEKFIEASFDYVYHTYGYQYGLQRNQIDEALAAGRYHFVICNDIAVIRALRRDYGARVRVMFFSSDAPRAMLEQIQRERGITDDNIELRLEKMNALHETFVEEYEHFDAVIVNHFGAPQSLRKQLEKLLIRFAQQETQADNSAMSGAVSEILSRLQRERPDPTPSLEPGFAFILMAMTAEDPALVDVHQAIRRACTGVGVRAERVDDVEFTGKITAKVISNIRLAEFVIADLTHERPNVYYEIGYADAIGKPLILLARTNTKVHFDIQDMRILYYRNMAELEEALQRMLRGLQGGATH